MSREREYEYTASVRGTVWADNLEDARKEVRRTIGEFCSVDIEEIEPVDDEEDEID
jgi:hypothetical protein